MKDLKQFIKTSVREFLNENSNTNNIDVAFNHFMNKNLNYELQENLENSYDELKNLIRNNTIKAYRLLNVDDINDIDKNNLGKHFTPTKNKTKKVHLSYQSLVVNYRTAYNKVYKKVCYQHYQ